MQVEVDSWEWMRHGLDGILVRVADESSPATCSLVRRIVRAAERIPGVESVTPGPTTVLLEGGGLGSEKARVERALREALATHAGDERAEPVTVEVPVSYDGEDLEEFAGGVGMSVDEVVRLHTKPIYHVEAIGFAPGFPYLAGLDPRLHRARKETPRTRIPEGSVAIGGSHTGVYTIPSPGGWHLLGTTSLKLFDRNRPEEEMFLLEVGDRVRFVPL